jgi:hypothetical protein
MARQLGSKTPKPPQTEKDELTYYRALHFLRESAAEEDALNDALIELYRKQCRLMTELRPFATWEEIGDLLGLQRKAVANRYSEYSDAPESGLDDES